MNDAPTSEEIIPQLIRYMFTATKCRNAEKVGQLQWRLAIGFRKFAALAFVTQPDAIAKGLPAWKVAEALGITPAQFSRLTTEASEALGGLAHPSARSRSHRIACRNSRLGKTPVTKGRRARNTMVETVAANRYRVAEQVGVANALKVFTDGGNWSKAQVRLLFSVGYTDEDGTLTAQGVEALAEDPTPTPGKKTVSHANLS